MKNWVLKFLELRFLGKTESNYLKFKLIICYIIKLRKKEFFVNYWQLRKNSVIIGTKKC